MPNKYLMDNPDVARSINAHNPGLVTETIKRSLGDGDGESFLDFTRDKMTESNKDFFNGFTDPQFDGGEVTGRGLAMHNFNQVTDYLHTYVRGMLSPTSSFNLGLDNGVVYTINWSTDIISVQGRRDASFQVVADTNAANTNDMNRTASKVGRRARRVNKQVGKLSPADAPELETLLRDNVQNMLGEASQRLELPPGQ